MAQKILDVGSSWIWGKLRL